MPIEMTFIRPMANPQQEAGETWYAVTGWILEVELQGLPKFARPGR